MAIFLGGAAIVGVYLTWRTLLNTLKNTRETLHLTHEGQITERFTQAIDQLGSTHEAGNGKNLEVRLDGIYALERNARDSARGNHDNRDHETILQILTAYARDNYPRFAAPTKSQSRTAPISTL